MTGAKAYSLSDCWPAIGLVRDAQQRDGLFYELAEPFVDGDLMTHEVAPPEWRWYRFNPCSPYLCGEHKWHYDDGKQGQRGSFVASLIIIRRKAGDS